MLPFQLDRGRPQNDVQGVQRGSLAAGVRSHGWQAIEASNMSTTSGNIIIITYILIIIILLFLSFFLFNIISITDYIGLQALPRKESPKLLTGRRTVNLLLQLNRMPPLSFFYYIQIEAHLSTVYTVFAALTLL